MANELHILMLEDVPSDAQLSEHTLRGTGLAFTSRLVDTADSYIEALDSFAPDLILADFSLPGFDGLSALKIAQARCPDVPFILLSGNVGDETAVESLKSGASDFVLKDRLERLGPAVKRALAQAQEFQKRKQAEIALSEERNLLRTLIDNLPDYIFIKDLQDRFVLSNIPHARAVQRAPEELIGKTAGELFSPELAVQYEEDDQLILQTGQPLINIERTSTDANGNQRAVLSTKLPLRDRAGKVIGLVGISRDVTERKRADEALRKSEASFRHLFASNPHPMYVFDVATLAFLDVNEALVTQYGYSREEFLQMRITDIRLPEDIPGLLAALPFSPDENGVLGEWRHRRKDGSVLDVEVSVHPLEFAGRRARLVVAQDITERKRAEIALRESEASFRHLFANNPHPMYVVDLETLGFLDVNEALVTQYGYSREEFLRMRTPDIRPEEDIPRLLAAQPKPGSGQKRYGEWRHRFKDGRIIDVEIISHSLQFAGREAVLVVAQDITERKRAEAALAEERTLLHTLLDTLPDAIYVKDTQGRFLLDNLQSRRNVGTVATPSETIGKTDFDFHPRELAEQFYAEEQRIIQTGQPLIDHEEPDIDPQGSLGWHLTTKVPLRDQTGQIIGIVGVSRDITERKRAEETLAQERNLLVTLIDSLPDGVYIKDRQSRIIIDNVRNRQNLGFGPQEESIGKSDFDFHPPEMAQQFFDEEQRLMQSGEPLIDVEEPNIDLQGNLGWHLSTKVPLRDRSGQVVGLVGVSRDITERKRAEEELRRSEATEREQRILAEALRDSATALTSSLDPEVVLQRIVENLQRVVPHQAANIMLIEGDFVRSAYWHGYPMLSDDYFKTYRLPLTTANLQTMLRTRALLLIPDTQTFPGWEVTPEIAWIRSYAGVPIEAHGQVIGFLNVDSPEPNAFTIRQAETLKAFADQAAIAIENAQLYDQLRRYASQLEEHVLRRTAELNRVKEHVEAILANNSDGIVVTQLDSIIQQTNPAFDRLFGYQASEAVGLALGEVVQRDSGPMLAEALTTVLHEYRSVRLELTAQRHDHTPFYADLALSPITGNSDELLGIVCSVRDITERKQMEGELRQALIHEMELGDLKSRFVTMASHEFRTPLTTIMGSVGLLELGLDKMTAQNRQKHFAKIQEAIRHITRLLEDVLTIGKADAGYLALNPELIDLDELCRDVIEEFQVTIAKMHVLDYSSQVNCKGAWLDQRMVRLILSNLLSNAIKFSAQGSPVKLTLVCELDRSTIRVQDRGIGIPEHDQKLIFEAFHRAKNVGTISGTGLGLAVTKKAVDLHGGTITFETQVGNGTTFTVTIPTGGKATT